ncbi:MAG: hypothetical protein KF760_28710 [Candidatus Eremiobacteraeota bacterium]|nr:hypothetical protein [Candidatus Eremiobacteraeota bacterium]MCW5865878.1 hypothetical protein [Candidatus Eremiobacteraeota bacterium]
MSQDVPALIEKSLGWCQTLNTSMAGSNRRMDDYSGLLDGLNGRLDGISREGDAAVQTVEQSFADLEQLLDQLQASLERSLKSTGVRVDVTQTNARTSMDALSTASSQLGSQNTLVVSENQARHQTAVSDADQLSQQLSSLLGRLTEATDLTGKKVDDTHVNVQSRHQELQQAVEKLGNGFAGFDKGLIGHHQELQANLAAASSLSAQQLASLQTDLQKQLDDAMRQIQRVLDENAKGLHTHANSVEGFLEGLLTFLRNSRDMMDNKMRPPVDMIANIEAAIQPVVNLLGLLQEVGLI